MGHSERALAALDEATKKMSELFELDPENERLAFGLADLYEKQANWLDDTEQQERLTAEANRLIAEISRQTNDPQRLIVQARRLVAGAQSDLERWDWEHGKRRLNRAWEVISIIRLDSTALPEPELLKTIESIRRGIQFQLIWVSMESNDFAGALKHLDVYQSSGGAIDDDLRIQQAICLAELGRTAEAMRLVGEIPDDRSSSTVWLPFLPLIRILHRIEQAPQSHRIARILPDLDEVRRGNQTPLSNLQSFRSALFLCRVVELLEGTQVAPVAKTEPEDPARSKIDKRVNEFCSWARGQAVGYLFQARQDWPNHKTRRLLADPRLDVLKDHPDFQRFRKSVSSNSSAAKSRTQPNRSAPLR